MCRLVLFGITFKNLSLLFMEMNIYIQTNVILVSPYQSPLMMSTILKTNIDIYILIPHPLKKQQT